jgi:hypothetical protein
MALQPSIVKYTPNGVPNEAIVSIAASGNYVTGGDTVNLNPQNIKDPNGVGLIGYPENQPKTPPSIDAQALSGYYAQLVPGATLGANKIQFFLSEGNELAAGAYPAAILGGTLTVKLPV